MKKLFTITAIILMSATGFSQTTYTFTGNGNWTVQSNWDGASIPPSLLPAGSTININPMQGDSCVLNTTQTIASGANLNIAPGAIFIIRGNMTITSVAPTLTTKPITEISVNNAVSGGKIISNGGSFIFSCGVVWDTSPNPTIALSTKTADGFDSDNNFLSYVGGLQSGTTYYLRAYATNTAGTSYGNELSFTTLLPLPSITIGSQTWTSKNLDVVTYRNGDTIPQVTDPSQWASLTTGAWCYYNNDSTLDSTYGKLYNWYAVNDSRGLAPFGWHVPSNSEWNVLAKFLDPLADTTVVFGVQSNIAGGAMKESGLIHWTSPNAGATNSSGFNALPGGGRDGSGVYYGSSNTGYWWSSTTYFGNVWTRNLVYYAGDLYKYNTQKAYGISLRCLKD